MTSIAVPSSTGGASATLTARPVAFEEIPRTDWDRLLAASPAATPFSRWTFHRAWWDAYGATAHEQYLVCVADPGADGAIRAIVPLMHRHEVEPGDDASATILRSPGRPATGVAPDAKAIFMAASYHADYATLLAAEADLGQVANAVVEALSGPPDARHGTKPWDAVDLRRFRGDDRALDALEQAFGVRSASCGWVARTEPEDVCPVVTLPSADWDEYLATLGKQDRHEIRRKWRRLEAAGDVRFELMPLTAATIDGFIDLHQARWGDRGLFPPTEGGARSRRFLHRLAELEAAESEPQLQLGHLRVGDRLIFAGLGFDDGTTCFFYNAGLDPDARDLSPGVTGTAAYLRDRQAAGRLRFDFLRGNEPYKYQWGAVDEPIRRLLVTRTI
jgi:CelD/BcsL family acetyltransferase involved in cellulose biosynthesis